MFAFDRNLSRLLTKAQSDDWESSRISTKLREGITVGVTGSAGAGKSSTINHLANYLSKNLNRIAILACDPSTKSGGALLGDRVHFSSLNSNERIFIRSLASRGEPGGLAPKMQNMVNLLDEFGFQLIVVETTGIGQGESRIEEVSDVVIQIVSPSYSDQLQAMKNQSNEVTDIFFVNQESGGRTDAGNTYLSALRELFPTKDFLLGSAKTGQGIEELANLVLGRIPPSVKL